MNPIKRWLFLRFLRWYRNSVKDHKLARIPVDQHLIQDEAYTALWDSKTGYQIRRWNNYYNQNPTNTYQEKLRHMNDIHEAIKRKYNDQTLDKYHCDLPIPLAANYKKDRITFNGVSLIWSRFAGSSEIGPTHMAVGHGTSVTTDDMTALEFQNAIESLTGNASMTASGAVLRFQGTFDILEETFLMSEVGVFAGDPGGVLISRTLFDDPLIHTYGENYPSADYAIHTLTA